MRTAIALLVALLSGVALGQSKPVVVGSKAFTESYILGEIAKRVLTDAGFAVEHKQGMGATGILWSALTGGSIDLYPDYTGTVGEEILKKPGLTEDQMREELAKLGIGMSRSLGFSDAYGLVMRRKDAERLGISKISDLKGHPELRVGITPELVKRSDGWGPLTAKYGLAFDSFKTVVHTYGYTALSSGSIDLKDCYTTDAEIKKYDLRVLRDDLGFFPLYRAVFLYRLGTPKAAIDAIDKLAGTIDESLMISLNAKASETKDYAAAATQYFASRGSSQKVVSESLWSNEANWIGRHLLLVGISLFFAVLIGIPLGIWAARPGIASNLILGFVGMVQTIPSLALLALLVPLPFLGISMWTAIVALFLYSLLPIVRNTATGIQSIPQPLRESAEALGLEPGAQLRQIYLPMASRTILAGIKTSAVINVGTATLAALIGGGGLGQPIVSGLSLNDNATILQGAIPAALLAILVQLLFDAMDRIVIPKGLRLSNDS